MAFNYFYYGQDVAVIGMKADSTVDVIDSYACEGTDIYAGSPVELGTDPAKQVAASTTAANVIGIAIHENKAQFAWATPGTPVSYPEGYAEIPQASHFDLLPARRSHCLSTPHPSFLPPTPRACLAYC